MINESIRRMHKLCIPEDVIQQFKDTGTAYCTDPDGNAISLSDKDKKGIEAVEECGCKVYVVTHSISNGVEMTNYLITSDDPADWKVEFYDAIPYCYGAYAFVESELTHGTFDTGYTNIYGKDGCVKRVSKSEALQLSGGFKS